MIVLFSDGEETCGGDPAAAVTQIKEEYDIAFEIYVIGILVDSRVRAHLQGIADAGAGIYFDVRSRAALNNALASIDLLVEGEEESTPPADPIASSSSHTPNESSDDPTIDITWPAEGQQDGASDATGVDGYSWSFTENPTDLPDTVKDGEEYVTTTTSPPLPDGSWWFHLRTHDNAGNWTSTLHLGPFPIDTSSPPTKTEPGPTSTPTNTPTATPTQPPAVAVHILESEGETFFAGETVTICYDVSGPMFVDLDVITPTGTIHRVTGPDDGLGDCLAGIIEESDPARALGRGARGRRRRIRHDVLLRRVAYANCDRRDHLSPELRTG